MYPDFVENHLKYPTRKENHPLEHKTTYTLQTHQIHLIPQWLP